MRTIIAGCRTATDFQDVQKAIEDSEFDISVVISGAARGADKLGEEWAARNNISIERYPANWDKYGRSAGPIRNGEMAKVADALIALWDGQSRGTKNMIETAEKKGLKVHIHYI